jgi:hypothetical protein
MHRRNTSWCWAWVAALWLGAAAAASGETVTLKAVLIHASNHPAPIDSRLERVEYKLRRIFGFEHYRFLGESSVILNLPGDASLDLARGHRLKLSGSKAKGDSVRVRVEWLSGDESLLTTSVVMERKSAPAILGGPAHEGGNLIVTLEAR